MAIVGLALTVLAAWRGSVDATKSKSVSSLAATVAAVPVAAAVEMDERYIFAVEALTKSQNAQAAATMELVVVNRQSSASMGRIATVLHDWRDQYERDKSDGRFEALEQKLTHLYGAIGQGGSRPPINPRRRTLEEPT